MRGGARHGFQQYHLAGVLFLFLQPILAAQYLKATRTGKFAAIQRSRKSRLIAVIHRQEECVFGFPLARYIDMDDAEKSALCHPHDAGRHTARPHSAHARGLVIAAVQIARAIKAHPGKVTSSCRIRDVGRTLLALRPTRS